MLSVARHVSDSHDSVIVVTNPDEDRSPQAFRVLVDELLAGPEPGLESIGATSALRELRVDSDV